MEAQELRILEKNRLLFKISFRTNLLLERNIKMLIYAINKYLGGFNQMVQFPMRGYGTIFLKESVLSSIKRAKISSFIL